jgi:hypothetical protein
MTEDSDEGYSSDYPLVGVEAIFRHTGSLLGMTIRT